MNSMPPMPAPPMDDPMMGGPEAPQEPMDGGVPGDEPDMEGADGQVEDKGVGSDVREYSGELSQALNDYNEENPSDEEKLNKYAINMIASQVADALSDKDKRQVIKKLRGNEEDLSNEEPQEEMPMESSTVEEDIVNEIVNDLITNNKRGTKRDEKYVTNKDVTKRNPFVSGR